MSLFNEKTKEFDADNIQLEAPVEEDKIKTLLEEEHETLEQGIKLTEDFFGPLWPLVQDDNITDIDWNGHELLITTCANERKRAPKEIEDQMTDEFLAKFTSRASMSVSKEFNKSNPVLEAETETLRLSIVHECVARTGMSICIRKAPPFARINMEDAIVSGYITPEIGAFLKNAVISRLNCMVCGGVGVGKTEFVKLLAQYIPKEDRIITIEDNLELHLKTIYPDKDVVEMQISPVLDYRFAIKTSLRQDCQWVIISEVRDVEVADYINCLTTGFNGLTTVHTDDARKIPDRIVNMSGNIKMSERILGDVYSFLNIGVLVARRKNADGNTERFIDQVVLFTNENGRRDKKLIFNNRKMVPFVISPELRTKFERAYISNPFYDKEIDEICKRHNINYDYEKFEKKEIKDNE